MDIKEFQEHQEQLLKGLLEKCQVKQKEYANGKNGFHNFEEAAGLSMHNEREAIAWEFCVKHLQSVRDIVKNVESEGALNGYPTQEVVDEKFGDIIIYMTLIHGMLTERIKDEQHR